jgi:hypothetical protein
MSALRPVDLMFPENAANTAQGLCIPPPRGCGKAITGFKDELSRKEFAISGLCQSCQDSVFSPQEVEK